MSENIKAFRICAKSIVLNLLEHFPNKTILLEEDFTSTLKTYKLDFKSCVNFLKKCKILNYKKEHKGDFLGICLSARAYLYFSKNTLNSIDDLIEFCLCERKENERRGD